MTVTSVNAFANTHGGVDAESVKTYTNVYHVYTDDKNDSSVTARGPQAIALGLPAYGDTFAWGNDVDVDAICKTRSADLVETDELQPYYRKWAVTCGYDTRLQQRDPSTDQSDPAAEPWKVSGSFVTSTKPVNYDKDGKLITNSAEEAIFDDIPTAYDTLILEGNTALIDLAIRSEAKTKCNSTPMWDLVQRQALLMQWTFDVGWKNNVPYAKNRLEFWIADPGYLWNLNYIDHGTRTIVDPAVLDPRKRYRNATAEDMQLRNGIFLDGAGGRLDLVANPNGFLKIFENIEEYDFLANLTFLPNPLPGPF